MLTLKGKYNEAVVYTDMLDDHTISQIISLCNQEFAKDSQIRIMPDTHSGKGCVIGTSMTITQPSRTKSCWSRHWLWTLCCKVKTWTFKIKF